MKKLSLGEPTFLILRLLLQQKQQQQFIYLEKYKVTILNNLFVYWCIVIVTLVVQMINRYLSLQIESLDDIYFFLADKDTEFSLKKIQYLLKDCVNPSSAGKVKVKKKDT